MICQFNFQNVFYTLGLMIGALIHLCHSPKRSYFYLRVLFCGLVLIGISFAIPTFLREYEGLNSLTHVLLFALVVGMGRICYEDTFFHTVNKCVFGWLTMSCAFVWARVISIFFRLEAYYAYILFVSFLVNCGIFLLCSFLANRMRERQSNRIFNAQLILIESIVVMIFSFVDIISEENFNRQFLSILVLTIVYLCFLLLNAYSDEKRLADEKKIVAQMHEKEKQQWQLSKEYIDMINIKSHDMKHLIYSLSQMVDSKDDMKDELKRIGEMVDDYDAGIKTGNNALDIVLTEKARHCMKKEIQLTAMADGSAVAFMRSADIYSLVGNILDNAIEAQEGVLEKGRRVISFIVKKECGVVHIFSENYCNQRVRFVDGLPVTSKKDSDLHGFGTKSIQLIAEKYGGYVSFKENENFFVTDIVIPFVKE